MGKNSPSVASRLIEKSIKILNYISMLQRSDKLSVSELADRMGAKTPFVSRVLRDIGGNLTLETIARFEEALGTDVIVTPLQYEETLLANTQRLEYLVNLASKYSPEFKERMHQAWGQTTVMVVPSKDAPTFMNASIFGAGQKIKFSLGSKPTAEIDLNSNSQDAQFIRQFGTTAKKIASKTPDLQNPSALKYA